MIDRAAFVSTALQGASWDSETGELTVTFRTGDAYTYEDVPEEVWQEFKGASSPGSFYFSSIRGNY